MLLWDIAGMVMSVIHFVDNNIENENCIHLPTPFSFQGGISPSVVRGGRSMRLTVDLLMLLRVDRLHRSDWLD